MAFHIQKPSVMIPGRTVYYTGTQSWSDDPVTRRHGNIYYTTNLMVNPDGTNGGWTGATVVEE